MLPLPMGIARVLAWLGLLLTLAGPGSAAAQNVLRVGTSGDYAPFSLASPVTLDGVDGFDVALARAYAAERGLKLEWVRFTWPALLSELSKGSFDVAMSGITVRPDRSLAGSFSLPLVESGAVVLVNEPSPVASLEKLDQLRYRIGVNAGGHLERVAQAHFRRATLLSIPENEGVLRAFLTLAVDAVVTDTLEAPVWEAQAGKTRRFGPFTRDRKAFLVHPDRGELAADLDRWLLAREGDGSLAKLRRRWMPGLPAGSPTEPLAALVAAMDERLALMPWVVATKREAARPIQDRARETRVIAAGVAAVARAAAASGAPAPPDEAVKAFFRAQIDAAKQVQLSAGRDEDFAPVLPLPDLEQELRPALIRIGDRIARLLVALPEGLERARVAAACSDGLRSEWLAPGAVEKLGKAVFELARQRDSARASQPATNGSSKQEP